MATTTGSHDVTIAQNQRNVDGRIEGVRTTGQGQVDVSLACEDLAELRKRIGEALHLQNEDFVLDVQLVATELASNACDHAKDPRHLSLRREIHPDRGPELVIEAHDATPDRTPVVGSSSISLHRGNGMKIIQTICNDWGVRQGTDHKVVWGRIRMP
ncbi:ATP-binding protein [Saccharothrix sp. Mg75]|uniref:ATP-binding protein n=1 Tax=Saccharothrix sp. Mg75 TaxID=3445357 RepID=UPI003EE8FB75